MTPEPTRTPLEIELLISADQRRPLSVAGHHAWRESLAASRSYDEVDELVEELRAAQPEGLDQ